VVWAHQPLAACQLDDALQELARHVRGEQTVA
jgi:hypothetical protein